jgi:hypothetical protein
MIRAALLLTLAATSAQAEDRPASLTGLLDYHVAACAGQGGTLTVAPDAVSTIDLNGDGAADFILDSSKLTCSTQAAMFCVYETGCELSIFVGDDQHTFIVKEWSLRPVGTTQHIVATIDGDLLQSPVDITSHLMWDDAAKGLKIVPAEN